VRRPGAGAPGLGGRSGVAERLAGAVAGRWPPRPVWGLPEGVAAHGCLVELRAPRLHALLAHPALAELAHGAKGVGSQGDGCAQIAARGPEERERLAAILERDLGVRCLPLTLSRRRR
jgi:hypothetical protein